MKFSVAWLSELSGLPLETTSLADNLTAAGLEVDAVTPAAGHFSGVVVARITATQPHPDADRLKVCTVDCGDAEPLQIVCGAPNARIGLHAPLAKVGAVLPGGFTIKPAKLRGVESSGMLCSGKELGLDDDTTGLMELSADAPVGKDIVEWLQADDDCIEIDLTPNRADCLSMRGLHREIAALYGHTAELINSEPVTESHTQGVEITIESPADCPSYMARLITNLNPDAATPIWMSERLRRSGLRSKSPLVDVTNYVLLEYGQPLHAFDADLLRSKTGELPVIGVRRARAGEALTLLNDQKIELQSNHLVITADDCPEALAGVMGGNATAITDSTANVLLESAWFNPALIMGRSRDLGLSSDAAHRFERGIDPTIQMAAMQRATQLLIDIAGGQAGPVCIKESAGQLPQSQTIRLRQKRINALLGTDISETRITGMLESLGMQLELLDGQGDTATWDVTPPRARLDIAIEADLIEEVARLFGYENIPTHLPAGALRVEPIDESQRPVQRLHNTCIDLGYQEAMTYSFVDQNWQANFDLQFMNPEIENAVLQNPISQELAVMRRSLVPGLASALKANRRQHGGSVRLFETGTVFSLNADTYLESQKLAMVACGLKMPEQWQMDSQPLDFYAFKGDIEHLLNVSGKSLLFTPLSECSHLHPGQAAEISTRDASGELITIGYLGLIHPLVARQLKVDNDIFIAELDLSAVLDGQVPVSKPLSRFPSIRRDLALLIPLEITAEQVISSIHQHAGDNLKKTVIFDVYTGKHIENSYKSLAIGLILQNNLTTLTDDDADQMIDRVLKGLKHDHDITLRDE